MVETMRTFILVLMVINGLLLVLAENRCCKMGVQRSSKSMDVDCSTESLTGADKDDQMCGIMYTTCCENSKKSRKCEMGITFARAGIMCPLSDVIATDCCVACKESTQNGCETDYEGSGYAKNAFKRCCETDKTEEKDDKEAKKTEVKDKKKKEEDKTKDDKTKEEKTKEDKKKEEKTKENKTKEDKTKEDKSKEEKKTEKKKKCNCDRKTSTGCKMTEDGPQCICKNGFQLNDDGECEDINECEIGPPRYMCNPRYWCWNEIGYFRCVYHCQLPSYRDRYIGNRKVCEDVDECAEGTHTCNRATHKCVNKVGGYWCKRTKCPPGYKMVQDRCQEIKACERSPCGANEYCYNVYGIAHCIQQDCPNNRYYETRQGNGQQIKGCAKTKCDRLPKTDSTKCWNTRAFPSSIQRNAYKFKEEMKYGDFKFNYWWDFDGREYDVDIRISEGNEKDVFYIQKGNSRLTIINHRDVRGPQKMEFTMQLDATSRTYRNLVWRYHYKFFVYISAAE